MANYMIIMWKGECELSNTSTIENRVEYNIR